MNDTILATGISRDEILDGILSSRYITEASKDVSKLAKESEDAAGKIINKLMNCGNKDIHDLAFELDSEWGQILSVYCEGMFRIGFLTAINVMGR